MGLTVDQKALRLVTSFEGAGKTVRRVIINGKEIHLILSKDDDTDDLDLVDMKR